MAAAHARCLVWLHTRGRCHGGRGRSCSLRATRAPSCLLFPPCFPLGAAASTHTREREREPGWRATGTRLGWRTSRLPDDDYYAILSVAREASDEEIKQSYRRLCVLYHPDKYQDEKLRELASTMFPKIQTAFSVLSDPQQRAIYDLYGVRGLTAGRDLAPYYNTANEIKAEFELRQRRAEQERLLAMANPQGTVTMRVDATQLFAPFNGEDELADAYVSGMSITQSIETSLSEGNTLKLTGSLVSENGRGVGEASAAWVHQFDLLTRFETTLTAGDGRALGIRAEHTFADVATVFCHAQAREAGFGVGMNASMGAYRQLGAGFMGFISCDLVPEDGINAVLSYEKEKHALQTSVRLDMLDQAYVKASYTYQASESVRLMLTARAGLYDSMLSYGIARQISEQSVLSMRMRIGTQDGVTLRLSYKRLQQRYVLPVLLSDDLAWDVVLYGTIIPAALYLVARQVIFLPWQRADAANRRREARKRYASIIAERRREAMAAVVLMRETMDRRISAEEAVGGLIVVKAQYGQLVGLAGEMVEDDVVVDVTVPLQCMVKDHAIRLDASTKSTLVGFYDPCIDEPKSLFVQYRFKGMLHEVTLDDGEALQIPRKQHLIS